MKKIINYSVEDEILSFLKNHHKNLILFAILFAINILIFGQKLFFYNLAGDDYLRFYLSHDTSWLIGASGRWAQVLLNTYIFNGNMHVLPYVHGLVGVFSYTLMGFLTAKYFGVRKTFEVSIVTLLISATPMFAHNIFYTTNITASITFSLGIIGFLLGHKKQLFFKVTGFMLLVFSIGSYQTIIQIVIMMIVIKAIIRLLNTNHFTDLKSIVIDTVYISIFSMLALFAALKVNKLFLYLYDIGETSRMSNFGTNLDFIDLMKKLFTELPKFDNFQVTFYSLYLALCLLFLLAILYKMIMDSKERSIKYISLFLIVLSISVIPIIINIPLVVQEYILLRAYLPISWMIAGVYIIQISIFRGIFRTFSNLVAIGIILVSMYYINIFFDAANRQVKADIIRANMMVERIRTNENYTSEPLKLNIYGRKLFTVIGWRNAMQHQAFSYEDGKYEIIKYFTDLKFKEISHRGIEDVIDHLVEQGEEISAYPGKNSVVVHKDKAVIFLDARYANKRINTAKLTKNTPDLINIFDIYLEDNILFYKKMNCSKSDTSNYILQLYPDLEDNENTLYRSEMKPVINMDFRFHDFGVLKDDICIAARRLPEYKFRKIVVGQYTHQGEVKWKDSLEFEKSKSKTLFNHHLNLKNVKRGIQYSIDEYNDTQDSVTLKGWAFIKQDKKEYINTYIVAKSESQTFFIKTLPTYRLDVVQVFKSDKLNFSGFDTKIYKSDLPHGTYDIGILLYDYERDLEYYVDINESISI